MRARRTTLPSLDELPQTVCFLCGISKINGLFLPAELAMVDGRKPRCRLCLGELNGAKKRKLHPWGG